MGDHHGYQFGVDLEEAVQVGDVAGTQGRGQYVWVPVVAEAATRSVVVGDVARRLLQVRHEPTALEYLRQQVRGLLARKVDAAQLRHAVVAVLEKDPVVEFLGPSQSDGGVDGLVAADVEFVHELLKEQAPEAELRPGVAGEQGSLHDLGQVDECEDGFVEVGEVAPEDILFVRCELLGEIGRHDRRG